jgi:hypothetical protein
MTLGSSEFYQDPTDPKRKEVTLTARFTHPVDKADFEKRVSIRYKVKPVENYDDPRATSYPFKVTYDEFAGEAYIRFAPVSIPEDDGEMQITIAPGVRSSRGGNATAAPDSTRQSIPGMLTYFKVEGVEESYARNDRYEPEHILTITTSDTVLQSVLKNSVEAFVLPKDKPATVDSPAQPDYAWYAPERVGPEVLKLSKPLQLQWIPTEKEHDSVNSAKFSADDGNYVYVRVKKGLKSFGEYVLSKEHGQIFRVSPFPKEVKILHEGSILSLAGEKKFSLMGRDLGAIDVEVSRLLPGTVNHLIVQSGGDMRNPSFSLGDMGVDLVSERFQERITLPKLTAGTAQYSAIDFDKYLRKLGGLPRGLFLLKVTGKTRKQLEDEEKAKAATPTPTPVASVEESEEDDSGSSEDTEEPEESGDSEEPMTSPEDQRLVLLTDLGLVVKSNADGSSDIFVQSIHNGGPVANAEVSILGRNGLPVVTQKTGPDGKASLPVLKDFKREKSPTAIVAVSGDDYSFMPYGRADRLVNTSRFDVGGLYVQSDSSALDARTTCL